MFHLLLFTYLLHFVSSQNVPSFVEVSPLMVKNVNDTADIFCKVKDLGENTISWVSQRGNELATLSINGMKGTPDPRISVKFDTIASVTTSTIHIANLQIKDATVYRCSINLPDDVLRRDVTLQVRSPPFFVGNTTDKVSAKINTNVTLECHGGGYPHPNITWTRENNVNLPNGAPVYSGSVLKITNIQKEHAGTYLCSIGNELSSAKKTYVVKVDYPPIVKPRNERVGQAIGHETYLECLIESSPAVEISWRRDNIPISDNQFYTQSQSAINEPLRSAVLKIRVDKRQYGLYTCEAKNDAGKGATTIELYQTDKEVCVQNCNVNSGHSIISMLDLKLSLTSVIMLLIHWQNM